MLACFPGKGKGSRELAHLAPLRSYRRGWERGENTIDCQAILTATEKPSVVRHRALRAPPRRPALPASRWRRGEPRTRRLGRGQERSDLPSVSSLLSLPLLALRGRPRTRRRHSVRVLEMSFFMCYVLMFRAGREGGGSLSLSLTGEGRLWFSDWAEKSFSS